METTTLAETSSYISYEYSTSASSRPGPVGFTSSVAYKRTILAIKIIECLIILAINPLTLVSIAWYKKLRQHSANVLIFSLTMSDFLGGVVNFSSYLTRLMATYDLPIPLILFWCNFGMGTVVLYTMVFSVLAIGVDRLIATWKPMKYKTTCTPRHCIIGVVLMWIAFVILIPALMLKKYFSLPPDKKNKMVANFSQFFPDGVFVTYLMPIIYATMTLNAVVYLAICKIFLNQDRKVGKTSNPDRSIKAHKRITKISFCIMSLLFLTWIPQFVEVSVPYPNPVQQFQLFHVRICIHDIFVIFFLSNSFLNSFVYAWQHRDYRRAYLRLLSILIRTKVDNSSNEQDAGPSSGETQPTQSTRCDASTGF